MRRIALLFFFSLLFALSCQAQSPCASVAPTSVTIPPGGGYSSNVTATFYNDLPGSDNCGIHPAVAAQLSSQSVPGGAYLVIVNVIEEPAPSFNWEFVDQVYAGPNTTCSPITYVFSNSFGETLTAIQPSGCNAPLPPANPVFNLGPAGSPANPQGCACDPVSTGNGNYYYVHTDLSVANYIPDLALVFRRSYNSLDNYGGPMGKNWTHNFNVSLGTATLNGIPAVVVKWGDGHNELYFQNGNGYVPLAPAMSSLTNDPNSGNYTVTRKDGVKFVFTSTGLLSKIQNRNGQSIIVTRDSDNYLLSVSDGQQQLSFAYGSNLLLSTVTDLGGRKVSYGYDTNGNLISETDPAGNATQYAYNVNNNLISVTLPNGIVQLQNTYGPYGTVVSQTNADGFTTTFAYSTPPGMQATITDPLGNVTIHNYGSPTASLTALTSIVDPLGHTTSFTYDRYNDITSITDPNGHTTSYTYDSFGNLLKYTDPLGNAAAFTYNAFSEPLTTKTLRGNTTTLSYDANGNLLTVSDPLGDTTALTYDSAGHLLTLTDPRANTTSLTYGTCSSCLSTITDPIGNVTSLAYDAIDRPISSTDAINHMSSITYDALSRITAFTDARGDQTLFAYDSVGHLTSPTDANKHAMSYAYDPVGNVTLVTDAMGHHTSYTYDGNNNLISFTNGNNHVTSYRYDTANRLLRMTSSLSETTSYSYDANGNSVAVTDAKGTTNTFAYDSDNRLTGINYSDGSTVAYTFDGDGDRLSMADSYGITSYAYDALNRVLSTSFPGGKALQYAYDAAGNRVSLQYPDGSVIAYAYDQDNRLSVVTDGLLRNSIYAYDTVGNVIKMAYPNGVAEQFAYDAANRLTQIVDQNGAGTVRMLAYVLDSVGNRANVTDNGLVTTYTYDPLNELTSSTSAGATTSWQYDAVGNRTKQVDPSGTTLYTYDAADQMLTAGAATFTYDKNGNRAIRVGSSAPTTYSYDAANRLVSAVSPSRKSSFTYDGDGNRVTQTTSAGTYSYVNDTSVALPVVLNESGPDGVIDYSYGLGLMESSSSAFNYFYRFDGLGSVSDLTDANGKVRERYLFVPWGNALTGKGSVGTENKFQFTGQALDPDTGLYFMRARYYEPTTGRFLTRDPFPGFAADPITLHPYIYARNNPIRFVDPSGKFVQVLIASGLAITIYCELDPETCAAPITWLLEQATNSHSGLAPSYNPADLTFLMLDLGKEAVECVLPPNPVPFGTAGHGSRPAGELY